MDVRDLVNSLVSNETSVEEIFEGDGKKGWKYVDREGGESGISYKRYPAGTTETDIEKELGSEMGGHRGGPGRPFSRPVRVQMGRKGTIASQEHGWDV